MAEEIKNKKKWYKTFWGVLILFFLWPFFLTYWIWKSNWSPPIKLVSIVGIWAFILLVGATQSSYLAGYEAGRKAAKVNNTPPVVEVTAKPTELLTPTPILSLTPTLTSIPTVAVKAKPTVVPTQVKQTDSQNIPPISIETVSQRNAVNKAKSYLSFSAFSHDGLVAQLEYDQFSHSDAVYAADNSGANWNEQAAKKAKSYMDISPFSRGSLIDQLKYEKFSQEQAEYGANAVGL